jgi:hypothetical protein
MNDQVCYCFGYSARDIRRDRHENGRSMILAKIETEKQFGRCRCAEKNPEGK